MERLGIYIHWPYCRSKCPYCAFYSRVEKNIDQQALIDGYLDDLAFYQEMSADKKVDTVFFGGGTPSLLDPCHIARIIDKICALWPCTDKMEISLEANPNTGHPGWMNDLAAAGVNRLSLGVQSLTAANLKFLGRTHTLPQAMAAIEEMQKVFANASIDLMYALPQQTLTEWEEELRLAARLGLAHLSLYQLTIEDGTCFSRKGVAAAPESEAAAMYELSEQVMATAGYRNYEISNYALPGGECRHNLGYWQGDDYVGVGSGAAGRLRCSGKIFETSYPRRCVELTPYQRAQELLLAGLRIEGGIDKKRFLRQCSLALSEIIDPQELARLQEEGLLIDTVGTLQATSKGKLLTDYLVSRLCL